MLKPLVIGSAFIGAFGIPVGQAEQSATPQFQPASPANAPARVQPRQSPTPPVPAWVEERRAQLGITEVPVNPADAPAAPEAPQPGARPDLPDWVKQRPTMDDGGAPERPQAPTRAGGHTAPELPDWVKQRPSAPADAPERPAAPERPTWVGERPSAPPAAAWADQRERPAAPARPEAPTPPPMSEIPPAPPSAPPGPEAAQMMPPPAPTPEIGHRPYPIYQPWQSAPYGGWAPPYGGWNRGWGNGWWPGGGGWGGSDWWPWSGGNWWPWSNGWGGDDWNRGYGSGYGHGWGNTWGDGAGDAAGDLDFSFLMRGRMSGDLRGEGYGDGYGYGRGYGYGYEGYQPYFPHYGPIMPPPHEPAVPAAPESAPAPDDGDGDGVSDAGDLCPDSVAAESVDVFGCGDGARIVLRGVDFDTDSAELTAESLAVLAGVSNTLTSHPDLRVMVAGHTDSDGEDAYNKDLSQRRAQSVVDYLAGRGVARDNLLARGFGDERPVASNETAEGKAENRRVELQRL